MSIEIELFGQLASHRQKRQTWEMKDALPVHEVVRKLGLKEEEIGLITVDGVQSELDVLVHPGSRLCFFSHMSGG